VVKLGDCGVPAQALVPYSETDIILFIFLQASVHRV